MTPRFLAYHAALFGIGNVFVFDNGSTDPEVLAELARFEGLGGYVDRAHATAGDFHRKGTVLGDLIKQLDLNAGYDFYIPLDCDEFVVLRSPGGGYTADPAAIRGYLDGLRGERSILRVTHNLANLLGSPDCFQLAEYSKTIYPRNVFLHMDHGYHTGVARDGSSAYRTCDLVYAHFHYRPYEEVVSYAKQKLRAELTDQEIADHASLRKFRGLGWHMVHYIVDGPEAYYQQFRGVADPVLFPALRERFAEIGVDPPATGFALPPGPLTAAAAARAAPPRLVIDDATTRKIRGWALDPLAPHAPLVLRFLVDGAVVRECSCNGSRPDVLVNGQPTDLVGFDFNLPADPYPRRVRVLTVQDRNGKPLLAQFQGKALDEVPLAASEVQAIPHGPVYSHIDSFRSGRVQGWVLRTVQTPDRSRLLGGCTVVMVHDRRAVSQTVADGVREDVAAAMGGEASCGFSIDVPKALMLDRNPVFRLFVMPEQRELTGSPCVVARNLVDADI